MRRNNNIFSNSVFAVGLLGTILFILACTDENKQAGLTGKLVGYVTSYDKNVKLMTDHAGIEVTIEGGSKPMVLSTDTNGKFEIDDLITGTYDIIIAREGFGTHKLVGYGFVGGEFPTGVSESIYQLQDVVVESVEVKDMSNSFQVLMDCKVNVNLPPARSSGNGIYRYFISNRPDVSTSNYLETGVIYGAVTSGTFSFLKDVNTTYFPKGSDLYLLVFPCTEPYQNYIDINTGNLIYSSVRTGEAKVTNFKIPL